VNTQELLVHDRGQRESAEGLHACLVDLLRILMLALELEREVVGQMPALVISSEKP
jgi:hypothetical protein